MLLVQPDNMPSGARRMAKTSLEQGIQSIIILIESCSLKADYFLSINIELQTMNNELLLNQGEYSCHN